MTLYENKSAQKEQIFGPARMLMSESRVGKRDVMAEATDLSAYVISKKWTDMTFNKMRQKDSLL